MKKSAPQSGQSLIEILFAIAIFTIGVFTIGYLVIDAQSSLQKNIEFTQARLLAAEGIEIVHALRTEDFNQLEAGTYGLSLNGTAWSLVEDEPDETSQFLRTITIDDVSAKVKHVVSTVTWGGAGSTERTLSLESYLSNWTEDTEDASWLSVDTALATTSGAGAEIVGLTVENTGPDEITMTQMVGEWSGVATLRSVTIGGTEVFAVATSSPTGIASGETVDIDDYLLSSGTGVVSIDTITFDSSVAGTAFTLTFTLSDGSIREVNFNL